MHTTRPPISPENTQGLTYTQSEQITTSLSSLHLSIDWQEAKKSAYLSANHTKAEYYQAQIVLKTMTSAAQGLFKYNYSSKQKKPILLAAFNSAKKLREKTLPEHFQNILNEIKKVEALLKDVLNAPIKNKDAVEAITHAREEIMDILSYMDEECTYVDTLLKEATMILEKLEVKGTSQQIITKIEAAPTDDYIALSTCKKVHLLGIAALNNAKKFKDRVERMNHLHNTLKEQKTLNPINLEMATLIKDSREYLYRFNQCLTDHQKSLELLKNMNPDKMVVTNISLSSQNIAEAQLTIQQHKNLLDKRTHQYYNSFCKILGDKKIDIVIDYINQLACDLQVRIFFKGGFKTLCGVFLYHNSSAASRVPINDIDITIYCLPNVDLLNFFMKEGFSFPNGCSPPDKTKQVIFYNLVKIVSGIKIDLTVVPLYALENGETYTSYKGNEFITPLTGGAEAYLCSAINPGDNHIHLVGKQYIGIPSPRLADLFQVACITGSEAYAAYRFDVHKKYCWCTLKNHIKHKEIFGEDSKPPTVFQQYGLITYKEIFPHLKKIFLNLLLAHQQEPHDEIISLIKEIEQTSDKALQKKMREESKEFLKSYLYGLMVYEIQVNNKIKPVSHLTLEKCADETAQFIKDYYASEPKVRSLSKFMMQLQIRHLVKLSLQFRAQYPTGLRTFAMLDQWKDELDKIGQPLLLENKDPSPLQKFSLHSLKQSPSTETTTLDTPTSTSSSENSIPEIAPSSPAPAKKNNVT